MSKGRPGVPTGEPLANELIRAVHQAHIDGMSWGTIAGFCDIDRVTLRSALQRACVSRATRERIERFIKQKAAAA